MVMPTGTLDPNGPDKRLSAFLWIIQAAVAGVFLFVGISKLAGAPATVGMFDTIGLGQWLRFVTGSLEVLGGLLLLHPLLCAYGALILIAVMTGAVLTHLFIIGGSPLTAIILLLLNGLILWGRRDRLMLASSSLV